MKRTTAILTGCKAVALSCLGFSLPVGRAEYVFTTYATGIDGAPLFGSAEAVAIDSGGNAFVADGNNRVIRKVTPLGGVTTIAGFPGLLGRKDGQGSEASFGYLNALTIDGAGNLYAIENYASGTIPATGVRKISPTGAVSTIAAVDGITSSWSQDCIAAAADGTVFLHDTIQKRICKVSPAGAITTLKESIPWPVDALFVGGNGDLYVAGQGVPGTIAKISPGGDMVPIAVRNTLSADLGSIRSLVVDSSGNLLFCEPTHRAVYKVRSDGELSLLAGGNASGGIVDGVGSDARFFGPRGLAIDTAGEIHVADFSCLRRISSAGVVQTVAGVPGRYGMVDGKGSAGGFNAPSDLAVAADGSIFVVDATDYTLRRCAPDGSVSVFAGSPFSYGHQDGRGAAGRFYEPAGIAVGPDNCLYIGDGATVRRVTTDGAVSTAWGVPSDPGCVDGSGGSVRFVHVNDLAADGTGAIYVADALTIRRIGRDGAVSTMAGSAAESGTADGPGAAARFMGASALAVDRAGVLYIADQARVIRRLSPEGQVSTIAGKYYSEWPLDGSGRDAAFYEIKGMAVDSFGNLVITEYGGRVRQMTPDGTVTTIGGPPTQETVAPEYGDADGAGSVARFTFPGGIASDRQGRLYICDSGNKSIRAAIPLPANAPRFLSAPSSLALNPGDSGFFTVTASCASPIAYRWQKRDWSAMAWHDLVDDDVFTGSDSPTLSIAGAPLALGGAQFRCVISCGQDRNVSATATLTVPKPITPDYPIALRFTTIAGKSLSSGYADGAGTEARFNNPQGLACDGAGNLYVADSGNNAIRKISPDGIVTTLAGGQAGTADGYGTAAQFNSPTDLAVNAQGFIYISDTSNCAIRELSPSGYVGTIAGFDHQSGAIDGPAYQARFGRPAGVAIGSHGEIYVADIGAGNGAIRMILSRRVSTLDLGTGVGGTGATDLVMGPSNTIYSADLLDNMVGRLRLDEANRRFVILAGDPWIEGFADGRGDAAYFDMPRGIALAPDGMLFVTDTGNKAIRMVTPSGITWTVAGTPLGGSADGRGWDARFRYPVGIAVDGAGNVYVSDTWSHTILKGVLDIRPSVCFLDHPADQLQPEGGVAVFEVIAREGVAQLRWERLAAGSSEWIVLTNDGAFSGVTTTTLSISAVGKKMNGDRFRCRGDGGGGTELSWSAKLTVQELPTAPVITRHPVSVGRDEFPDGFALFEVEAEGTAPLTYQWFRDNIALPFQSFPQLSTDVIGTYTVRVTNAQGYVFSRPATLTESTLLGAWRRVHFGTTFDAGPAANDADPDSDGRCNLLEYALGSVPTTADAGSDTAAGSVTDGAGTHLTLTFHRIADPALVYSVETSADLSTWQVIWSSTGAENVEGSVVVTDSETVENHPRRFLRLRVTN